MSNSVIAHRVLEVLAAFERGEVSASAIAKSLELHEPALEGIPQDVRDQMHSLSVLIIHEDVTPQEQALLGFESSRCAFDELRCVLEAVK